MSENSNRAFMYGESVFTTMRMTDSRVLDWDMHFERLKKGTEFLLGPFSQGENFSINFRERLENCWQRETGDKILRLTVFRELEKRGLKKATHISVSDLRLHISSNLWSPSRGPEKLLNLRTCAAPDRPSWWPSYLKSGNYLHTILAQKLFMQPDDDDLLFLSRSDTVTESSVANIFMVKNNKLYTAPLGPQVLDGVMRKKVINLHKDYFSSFEEYPSSLDQALRADAIFATNSVRGLMLIGKIDNLEIEMPTEIKEKLLELGKRLFT